jgi:hypothetical protein
VTMLSSSASVEATETNDHGVCSLTYSPLDVNKAIAYVQHDSAGAIAVFIGEMASNLLQHFRLNAEPRG